MKYVNDQFGLLVTKKGLQEFISIFGEEGAKEELAKGFNVAISEAIAEVTPSKVAIESTVTEQAITIYPIPVEGTKDPVTAESTALIEEAFSHDAMVLIKEALYTLANSIDSKDTKMSVIADILHSIGKIK